MNNKKFWAVLFSIIPGAGHMYLGLSKKGLKLMALFFGAIGLTNFLGTSILGIIAPVIWFYSIFDVRKCYSLNIKEDSNLNINIPWNGKETKILGYVFIGLGVIGVFNEILLPILDNIMGWRVTHFIKIAVISIILIGIGVKLITGKKIITNPQRLLKESKKEDL